MQNKEPLVSICTTFFNPGRYIHRFLDSSLNQTYKNIEVVLVDNASTDDSEKIIKEYAARDSRVKYFRNPEGLGITDSLMRTFKLAQGDFVIWPGADDWLARDYITNGVESFLRHPDAAGIVPWVIGLHEIEGVGFELDDDSTFPSKTYSSEWLMRRMYRSKISLCITQLALVRRKDAVSFMNYFLKNYCHNPSMPEELRELYLKKAFGIDIVFLIEILTRYKNFVWDNTLRYIKIRHSENISFDVYRLDSVFGIFKYYYYILLSYQHLYKFQWPKFYSGMKIYSGLDVLSAVIVYFIKSGLHPSFWDIRKSRMQILQFFSDFSAFEITAVVMLLIPMIISRFLLAIIRRIPQKDERKDRELRIFTGENFLDSEGRFKA